MRHPVKNRKYPQPDIVYNSEKVERLINYVMLGGKKNIARTIVYKAFDMVKEKTGNPNPLETFEKALKNAGPVTEVRSRRIGGANYQVPREVKADRRQQLALRWIIEAAKTTKGKSMAEALAEELLAAANNEGAAVTKRTNVHKMAEANKAFAHFSW